MDTSLLHQHQQPQQQPVTIDNKMDYQHKKSKRISSLTRVSIPFLDDTHVSTSDDSVITLDQSNTPNGLVNRENPSPVRLNTQFNQLTSVRKRSKYHSYGNHIPNSINNMDSHLIDSTVDIPLLNQVEEKTCMDSTSVMKSDLNTMNKHSLNVNNSSCYYFNPSGRVLYSWCGVISLTFIYHLWVIIYRFAFDEITSDNLLIWFILDYFADFLYMIDMAISLRTGFLEDGVMQFDNNKMRLHYLNSSRFYIDCLSLLPLDFLYLSIGFKSILRIFRLCKIYKFWQFTDRAERHATYPNLMRSTKLIFYYLTFLHWNACIFQLINDVTGDIWLQNHQFSYTNQLLNPNLNVTGMDSHTNFTGLNYLHAFYWSMLSLISIGGVPKPNCPVAYFYMICEGVLGVLLFATVLGHVSNIVTNVSAGRKEFQARLDSVKNYLALRRVPAPLQERVINWFDYLWYTNKITDEENVLQSLPDKLKAEIAIHVHLDTLKRVQIFQNTEEGFLSELVLRLRVVLFAPGDYVCRKGEIGKQMYIVNRGKLHVLGDDGQTVLATLHAGSYFGELSILNLGNYGNRRTASVRSLGYSDLFCLSKSDLWDVLKEYPSARGKLEADAYKKISQYQKPMKTINPEDAPTDLTRPNCKETKPIVDSLNMTHNLLNSEEPNRTGTTPVLDTLKITNTYGQPSLEMSTSNIRVSNSDGSDGYGSDPSRCSAFLPTPQRSPTPPNMVKISLDPFLCKSCPTQQPGTPQFSSPSNSSRSPDCHKAVTEKFSFNPADLVDQSNNYCKFDLPAEARTFCSVPKCGLHHCSRFECPRSAGLSDQRNLSVPAGLCHVTRNTPIRFHTTTTSSSASCGARSYEEHGNLRSGYKPVINPPACVYPLINESNSAPDYMTSYPLYNYQRQKRRFSTDHIGVAGGDRTTNISNREIRNSNLRPNEAEEEEQQLNEVSHSGKKVIPIIRFEKASTPSTSEATNSEDEQDLFYNPEKFSSTSSPIGLSCNYLNIPKHKLANPISTRPPWPFSNRTMMPKSNMHSPYCPGNLINSLFTQSSHSTTCPMEDTNWPLLEEIGRLNRRINQLENVSYQLQSHSISDSGRPSGIVNLSRKHSLPVKPANFQVRPMHSNESTSVRPHSVDKFVKRSDSLLISTEKVQQKVDEENIPKDCQHNNESVDFPATENGPENQGSIKPEENQDRSSTFPLG